VEITCKNITSIIIFLNNNNNKKPLKYCKSDAVVRCGSRVRFTVWPGQKLAWAKAKTLSEKLKAKALGVWFKQ
jgi:hypothetical protein